MSNHLVSQPLPISGTQTGQIEHIPSNPEHSMPSMQMGLMGLVTDNPASHQISSPKQQMGVVGPVPRSFDVPKMSVLGTNYAQAGSRDKFVGSQQFKVSPTTLEVVTMLNNQGVPHLTMPTKRNAPMEQIGSVSPRSSSIPIKRATHLEHRPWLLQQPAASRKIIPGQAVQQMPGTKQLPTLTKKLTQMESISPKSTSQRAVAVKNQAPGQSSGKRESFESVRAKMRESLAAALTSVPPEQIKSPLSAKKSQDETSFAQGLTAATQGTMTTTNPVDAVDHSFEEPKETLLSGEGTPGQKLIHEHIASSENVGVPAVVSMSNIQDFQSDNALSTDDVPFSDHFFVKDELLQGNGLAWVLESDISVEGADAIQSSEGKELVHLEVPERKEISHSPEELATLIETELYKLFGGVNKKYKEKGRSLLFNLKDRNNPELRERVASGEIPPGRLCSMSAEELASKELSEWRMAKAEELAQMVVLPDTEVDVRRLVKKTHKGEFQVEVEQDDSASVEVSIGGTGSSISHSRPRMKKESPKRRPNESKEGSARGGKTSANDKGLDYTLTIPPEDQVSEVDIMVDDAIGDLPPIVSLDEFMESLDSEPPFEDLQVEAGKAVSLSPDKELIANSPLKSPVGKSPKAIGETAPEKTVKVDEKLSSSTIDVKPSEIKSDSRLSSVISKNEQVWEGHLQLSISSTVSIIGGFKSGERTTAKEWSSILEIKGRVRLDAFEKFLQDLRMSRSRAIMVVHFLWREGSSENERASICEVADSYVLDERVGFAEPSQGVELYFCPPHSRTRDILGKILPEDQVHALESVDSGLIGVVIWRRTQFTSSSAIKPHSASKNQHLAPSSTSKSRHPQDEFDPNVTNHHQSSRFSRSARTTASYNVNGGGGEDDDDVPPGFGPTPGAGRDIDDLPEFNFSGGGGGKSGARETHSLLRGGSHPSQQQVPSRPFDQIRELIHKYGQSGAATSSRTMGVQVQSSWNDDDDDIPEWQPQGLDQSIQAPLPRADVGNRQHLAGHSYPSITGQVSRPPAQHQLPASWSSPTVQQQQQQGSQSYGGRGTGWRRDGHRGGGGGY